MISAKEVIVGPDVAKGFPTFEFKANRKYQGGSAARMYLNLLEDALLVGVGQMHPYTMLSPARLRNIRQVINEVIWAAVPGDFIETGVWRGGASIYARACLEVWGQIRKVYAADSFAGLPPPDPEKYPADLLDRHFENKELAVSLEEVKENFRRFGFENDEQTIFVQGWFDQSLPLLAPEAQFSVIRLDGDMYESTWVALENLYPKLSPGGFCIIDDFGAVTACQKAVNQFRHDHYIDERIYNIDDIGVFWQKERG